MNVLAVKPPLVAAAFASGSGTNFQALLDREERWASWRSSLLISDREDAGALERARRAGVAARVIPVRGRDPNEVAEETLDALGSVGTQVVYLAGYLHLVPGAVVDAYQHRILNVHPALLPSFGGKGMWGLRVHEAVLRAGCRLSGVTVHLVDARYDEGTILGQWPVPVHEDDNAESLAARVLRVEHLLYPLVAEHACRALAAGKAPTPFAAPRGAFLLGDDKVPASLETLTQDTFGSR